MKKSEELKKEAIRLSGFEILSSILDVTLFMINIFDRGKIYRKPINNYFKEREIDQINLKQKIRYLKKMGLITTYVENKERYIELTPKGVEKIGWEIIGKTNLQKKEKWDGKFRIVIFDVPEEKKRVRDLVRRKLSEIGFIQIQKSVFAYPFECKNEIEAICYYCSANHYLVYLIAEIIEGEEKIIDIFLENGTLKLSDLDIKK